MISSKTVYTTCGKDFPSQRKAIDYREDLVHHFFSRLPGFYSLPLSQRREFIEGILDDRQKLRDLLNFSSVETE